MHRNERLCPHQLGRESADCRLCCLLTAKQGRRLHAHSQLRHGGYHRIAMAQPKLELRCELCVRPLPSRWGLIHVFDRLERE